MATAIDTNSPDYKAGYKAGKKDAVINRRNFPENYPRAYWIVRKDGWYCSACDTKYEQAHSDFCCKCGAKMSEEADV
jgi:hypothetical protein